MHYGNEHVQRGEEHIPKRMQGVSGLVEGAGQRCGREYSGTRSEEGGAEHNRCQMGKRERPPAVPVSRVVTGGAMRRQRHGALQTRGCHSQSQRHCNMQWCDGDKRDRGTCTGRRNRAAERCAGQAAAEGRKTRRSGGPETSRAGTPEEPEQGARDFRGGESRSSEGLGGHRFCTSTTRRLLHNGRGAQALAPRLQWASIQAVRVRMGAAWNPKLGCEGKQELSTSVTLMQNNLDGNAFAAHGPMHLNVAMACKERAGKDY